MEDKTKSELTHYGYELDDDCKASSSFIYLFYPNANRDDLYQIARDFIEGRDFKHFLTKYTNPDHRDGFDHTKVRHKVDYRRLFTPTAYNAKFLINEYLDHAKPLRNLKGLKTPLNDKEKAKLEKFFEINDWNNLLKGIIKNRKIFGDEYQYIRIVNIKGFSNIPLLERLLPEKVLIVRNPKNRIEKEYIYTEEKSYNMRSTENLGAVDVKKEIIKLLFIKGKVMPFVDGELDQNKIIIMPKELDEYNPLLHFQYLKSEDSDYSEIPILDSIDSILRLHRIETDIAETNSKSGSPQLFVIDGDVDPESEFGAREIAYIDTTAEALLNGKQATLQQSEITNGLDSLYKEQNTVLNAVFSSNNLISPSMKEMLAKSDSSRVIKYLSTDLIEELRLAYQEISEKTKPLWKILFPNRKDEDIKLDIPLDLNMSSLLDKGQYINANIMTIKEMLTEQGRSKEEIEEFLKDVEQQISLFNGQGLSVTPILKDNSVLTVNKNSEPPITENKKEDTTDIQDEKQEDKEDTSQEMEGYDSSVSPSYNTRRGRN